MNCCAARSRTPPISSVESAAPTELTETQKRLGLEGQDSRLCARAGLSSESNHSPGKCKIRACHGPAVCVVPRGILLFLGCWMYGKAQPPERWHSCRVRKREVLRLNARSVPSDSYSMILKWCLLHLAYPFTDPLFLK